MTTFTKDEFFWHGRHILGEPFLHAESLSILRISRITSNKKNTKLVITFNVEASARLSCNELEVTLDYEKNRVSFSNKRVGSRNLTQITHLECITLKTTINLLTDAAERTIRAHSPFII